MKKWVWWVLLVCDGFEGKKWEIESVNKQKGIESLGIQNHTRLLIWDKNTHTIHQPCECWSVKRTGRRDRCGWEKRERESGFRWGHNSGEMKRITATLSHSLRALQLVSQKWDEAKIYIYTIIYAMQQTSVCCVVCSVCR